ncbi:mucin-4 isoform X2 [Pieris rapae]|uniref:mucin-4 isoform X2 n=1 Tax=Pieris rapae TaxID=64459 RepID=UPI001E28013E|nr:mucin-4 isoform X2 [Pieris rapae]
MGSMRYFSAGALFTIVLLTECLGANDRSRQRSGPIRSVPVAADIKREANFDCPEEFGYYPHPTDCTLYYVCVFGGALLESCTGGLMYSHELQTCDWPRNVGCDATGAVVADDLERLNEREPPPPPPRRNPPPAPRLQPKPVVTSRGQTQYSRREEYEKQQQLYAEVDDLPPVEELETDRQQRVYRGQPSTIGQVQKDRDGYVSQPISSGRTLNANIIPASLNQNSKIGSFSFGSQVDERRTATATQAPQTYSGQKDNVTDIPDRLIDISTNEIEIDGASFKTHQRTKRSTAPLDFNFDSKNQTQITKRIDDDQVMEYFEAETEPSLNDYDDDHDETERDKRQVRYYLKNGYKTPVKIWPNTKQIKLVDLQHYNPNIQSPRYQTQYNNDNLNSATRQQLPQSYFQNPYLTYQTDNFQSQRPFKPSIPDIAKQKPTNINTQIITKSPPISSLNNNDNPFASLSGGFYNNNQNKVTHNNQNMQYSFQPVTPKYVSFPDSSQLSTTLVTGKPVHGNPTISPNNYNSNYQVPDTQPSKFHNTNDLNKKPNVAKPVDVDEEYEDEDSDESDDEESEEFQNGGNFKPFSTRLPHEYTHPKNKYAHIDNPFANPNFDFDEFLSNLRENHYSAIGVTTSKPKPVPDMAFNLQTPKVYSSTPSYDKKVTNPTAFGSTGVSSPKPFTIPGVISNSANLHNVQHAHSNVDSYNNPPQVFKGQTGLVASKFKPPNFKDDRQLPLQYNFNTQFGNNINNNQTRLTSPNSFSQYLHEVTPKPFNANTRFNSVTSSTNAYRQANSMSSERPFVTSTMKPDNAYIVTFQQSTIKPSLANNQLAALQNHWKQTASDFSDIMKSTLRPNYFSDIPNLEGLFKQAIHPSSQAPIKSPESVRHYMTTTSTTTTKPPLKRKPIPKPSPEMTDYYYDDEDDQYYYEPMVKPKYMPSTEVKPQRPPMAQNYHEYDDSSEETGDLKNIKGNSLAPRRPTNPNSLSDSVTKNHNDVSVVTKVPFKQSLKNINGKIPVPVMGYVSPDVTHQDLNELSMVHHIRNRTYHMRVPNGNNPYTLKPPKYLNQTTLRPYTLRHRLAKPTTVKDSATQSEENKQTRGRIRHHNIVAQMKLTTPSDSSKQETRYTKTSHDDKINSLEPTESIPPSSYSASPRPKMLYNGSQAYSPDQYDPYYAVYDEDGELYKDTDYVQQYNVGSLRPAVQQTYRGTPPPARRPVETYTPRPVLPDDYDDALIQGQIPNQNQYQTAIRQQTRGDVNELGYDHVPSSVRTTIYEATSLSTTPPTTSTTFTTTTTTTTTSTTKRPTTAPFKETITVTRFSPRSSTDENSFRDSDPNEKRTNLNESTSTLPATLSSRINFSSHAKPFEKTDNLNRLDDNLPSTDLPTIKPVARVTPNSEHNLKIVQDNYKPVNKKMISLTTGFSIRRNSNDTDNPYTLTVRTKPYEPFIAPVKSSNNNVNNKKQDIQRYYYDVDKNVDDHKIESDLNITTSISENNDNLQIAEVRELTKHKRPHIKVTPTPKTKIRINTTPSSTDSTKFYLKTVRRRPATNTNHIEKTFSSTDNIKLDDIVDSAIQNEDKHEKLETMQSSTSKVTDEQLGDRYLNNRQWDESVISPYETLNNLRNKETEQDLEYTSTSTTTSTTSTLPPRQFLDGYVSRDKPITQQPSYYTYRVADDDVPDQTTEVFNGRVRNIIKTFFNSFTSTPQFIETTSLFSTPLPKEEVVNIGFQKKKIKYVEEKPVRNNIKYLQIITEPSVTEILPTFVNVPEMVSEVTDSIITSTYNTPPVLPSRQGENKQSYTSILESSTVNDFVNIQKPNSYESKFTKFVTHKPDHLKSAKYTKLLSKEPLVDDIIPTQGYDRLSTTTLSNSDIKYNTSAKSIELQPIIVSDIASTTSTTKSTTTTKTDYDLTSTKNLPFPTRVSRVNPAIKLAAKTLGDGRRSYQSSPNCSTDNRLQANPKCNEIKYQRPSNTRGRGSAHYSTQGGSDSPPQTPNRGTPPTRSRPTLKPSTAIVSKTADAPDIYTIPPSRPAPVYPQPQPDKTAAKCRKDVCLLPDCFCGGKDIPGNLPVDEVPQIVLITFDDAVSDLNKMYYEELFERGRVNPNGCPISATFYVSHEWTDYSQVQNLYADGHEFASHTISHSFGEQFSQKKWNREVGGQREILAAYGGVKLEDVRGMRAPFLSVGGNKMFKMLYDSNFTYDSSLPVYENKPPSWPYTLDYKLFHDCMIPPCPTKSYPGVWEVPMVMWQDLNGGRCSMGDACANPSEAEGVYKMILKNFDRHYTSNRAPFGLFYHAAWFTQAHHKEGFIMFLDFINKMKDVWIVTNWQALQWVRDPTPISRLNNFQPFQCNYQGRPKKCNNPKVCNLWHKSGVRYMRTCQPCPEIYPWTGKTGIRSSRIDNEIEDK